MLGFPSWILNQGKGLPLPLDVVFLQHEEARVRMCDDREKTPAILRINPDRHDAVCVFSVDIV